MDGDFGHGGPIFTALIDLSLSPLGCSFYFLPFYFHRRFYRVPRGLSPFHTQGTSRYIISLISLATITVDLFGYPFQMSTSRVYCAKIAFFPTLGLGMDVLSPLHSTALVFVRIQLSNLLDQDSNLKLRHPRGASTALPIKLSRKRQGRQESKPFYVLSIPANRLPFLMWCSSSTPLPRI